ncbi:MAG TPA: YsnF/AvaK domain-containing protein [Chondromyces sp.]|nr:YsnF/AvaK domain-containing protein [Chondromyces sp.]
MDNKKFIGTFNTEAEVIDKIQELKAQGYTNDDIYVVAKDEANVSIVRGRTDADVQAAGGSWMDRFMAFLSGEDSVRGGLQNMGLSNEDIDRYYTDIQNGSILLYVDKNYGRLYDNGSLVDKADDNLGPDPLNRTGYRATTDRDGLETNPETEKTVRLREEQLNVDKETVQTGEVRVDKEVVEEEQSVNVPVSREEVYIERRPVSDTAAFDEAASTLEDGESIRIPVTEERVEVSKRPVVNEEIVIGKRKVEENEIVKETVKREEAHIDRTGKANLTGDETYLDEDDRLLSNNPNEPLNDYDDHRDRL